MSTLATPSAELEIQFTTPEMCVGTWGNLIITSLAARPSIAALTRSSTVGARLKPIYPRGFGSVSIADRRVQMPEAETRKFSADLLKRDEAFMLGLAMVFEGEGFWAGTARTVMAGLFFVSKPSYPHTVCSTLDEAATFIVTLLKRSPPADRNVLLECLRKVRTHHASGSARAA